MKATQTVPLAPTQHTRFTTLFFLRGTQDDGRGREEKRNWLPPLPPPQYIVPAGPEDGCGANLQVLRQAMRAMGARKGTTRAEDEGCGLRKRSRIFLPELMRRHRNPSPLLCRLLKPLQRRPHCGCKQPDDCKPENLTRDWLSTTRTDYKYGEGMNGQQNSCLTSPLSTEGIGVTDKAKSTLSRMSQRLNIMQPLRSQQLGRHLTTSDAEINTHLHPLVGLKLPCSSPTHNDSGFDENLTQTGNFPLQEKHLADLCLHSTDPNSENRQPFSRHRQKEQRRPGPLSCEIPHAPYGPFNFDLSTPFVVPPPALLLSTPVLQSIPVVSPAGLYWPPLTPQTTFNRWASLGSPGQPSVTPNAYEVTSEMTKTPLTKASVSSQPPSCQRQREEDRGLSAELLLSLMARLQQNVREMVQLSLQGVEPNPSPTMATTPGHHHHHHHQQQTSKEGEEFGLKSMKRRSSTKGESSSSKWLKYDGQEDACFPLSPEGRAEKEEDEKVTRIASRRCDLLPASGRGNGPTDGNGTVTVHIKTKSTTFTPADEACLNKGGLLNGIHLRKAKLMFLYARYPTSSYLKSFFPEVSFTRYNTAQLVKWFSNFREFFYIHTERYVRGLIASGLKSVDSIQITPSHELCRTMILHYNRGLETKMPIEFPTVIEQATRQFFAAISSGADSKPSWKKNIYKNIAQLDQPIPESFRYECGLKTRP